MKYLIAILIIAIIGTISHQFYMRNKAKGSLFFDYQGRKDNPGNCLIVWKLKKIPDQEQSKIASTFCFAKFFKKLIPIYLPMGEGKIFYDKKDNPYFAAIHCFNTGSAEFYLDADGYTLAEEPKLIFIGTKKCRDITHFSGYQISLNASEDLDLHSSVHEK